VQALDHQWGAIFEQNGIQAGRNIVHSLRGIRQRHAAEAEVFSVIGIDGERRLEFAEGIATCAQDHGQPVRAWCGVELIFIAIRRLGEFFPFIFLQVQINGVAESRSTVPSVR